MDQLVNLLMYQALAEEMTEEELGIFIKAATVNKDIQREMNVITPPELIAFIMKEGMAEMQKIAELEDEAEQLAALVKFTTSLMVKMFNHPSYKEHELQFKQVYTKYGIDYDKYMHNVLPKVLELLGNEEKVKLLQDNLRKKLDTMK